MKILRLLVFLLIAGSVPALGQKPIAPKEWTPWAPNLNKWAEFLIITNFRGGDKTPEQLAKKDLKSLKVDCRIFGRLSKNLPYELRGIETVRFSIQSTESLKHLKTSKRTPWWCSTPAMDSTSIR